jgi:hypothetical protein
MRSLMFYFFLSLSLLLILPGQEVYALGESCPPCTAEKNALQQAEKRLQDAKDAIPAAEEKVSDAEDIVRFAFAALVVAEGFCFANPIACLPGVALAAAALDYANSKYQTAVSELYIARTEVEISELIVQRAQKKLAECQARANPGTCKKCEGGTVKADNDQDPGMCKKCQNGLEGIEDS